jgi:hypothetical protein
LIILLRNHAILKIIDVDRLNWIMTFVKINK